MHMHARMRAHFPYGSDGKMNGIAGAVSNTYMLDYISNLAGINLLEDSEENNE